MNIFDLRAQIETELIRRKYIYSSQADILSAIRAPTDEEIDTVYAKNIQQFVRPETILLSHIYFTPGDEHSAASDSNKELAEAVHKRIFDNEITFPEAVAGFSQDASSKLRNGRIRYVAINDQRIRSLFGDEFVDLAFSLPVDQVSSVTPSLVGFHILQVGEHIPPKLLALYDTLSPESPLTVAEYIQRRILEERQLLAYEEAYKQTGITLRAKAEVEVFERYLEDAS